MQQTQENQWGAGLRGTGQLQRPATRSGLPFLSHGAKPTPNVKSWVVDNASRDQSPRTIQRCFPQVKFLASPVNGGFAQGANLGINLAMEQGAAAIWLLNPDATAHPQALEALVRVMAGEPKVGAVASVLRWAGQDRVQAWGGGDLSLITGRSRHLTQPPSRGAPDYLCGASLLLRGRALKQVGLLDPGLPPVLGGRRPELAVCARPGGAWPWLLIRWWSISPAPAWVITKRPGHRLYTYGSVRFFTKHAHLPWLPVALSSGGPPGPPGGPGALAGGPPGYGKASFRPTGDDCRHDTCPRTITMKLLLWHWGRRGGWPHVHLRDGQGPGRHAWGRGASILVTPIRALGPIAKVGAARLVAGHLYRPAQRGGGPV